jgi:hypothetical protein
MSTYEGEHTIFGLLSSGSNLKVEQIGFTVARIWEVKE